MMFLFYFLVASLNPEVAKMDLVLKSYEPFSDFDQDLDTDVDDLMEMDD